MRLLGLALEEQITAFEPERRLAYRVIEGAPFAEHRAEVELEPDGDATRVRWSVRLRPRIPGTGWILRRLVERILRTGLAGLDRSCREG
jgi:carbon monoxide dehydrogenase subunit G